MNFKKNKKKEVFLYLKFLNIFNLLKYFCGNNVFLYVNYITVPYFNDKFYNKKF